MPLGGMQAAFPANPPAVAAVTPLELSVRRSGQGRCPAGGGRAGPERRCGDQQRPAVTGSDDQPAADAVIIGGDTHQLPVEDLVFVLGAVGNTPPLDPGSTASVRCSLLGDLGLLHATP
jgi:hypothetical protein